MNESNKSGIGAPVPRKEDRKFLTGCGRFVEDIVIPGALQCHIVRSVHARARIRAIRKDRAESMSGVAAVFTGEDMTEDGVGPMTCLWPLSGADGSEMAEPPRWALARGDVRHVGEPVAVVIAETLPQAADAAESLEVEYEALSPVTNAVKALAEDAPQLHDKAPGNVSFHWKRGDAHAVDDALANAHHVTRIELVNNRLAGAAIENRSVIGHLDPATDQLILFSSTQTPHLTRRAVAEELSLPEGQIRVISPDVGGGFGYKGKHYPEETIMPWAARRLGRPVRWIGSRNEAFTSDTQARDHATRAELALDREGSFLGLKVTTVANLGAYVSTFGANIPTAIYSALLAGVYKTPAISVDITTVFTNTVPTDAYRGAGRPEACFVLEQLVDKAARELGIDRAEMRRRNLISPEEMPYATPIGPTYDSGDFPNILSRVLKNSGYETFETRRTAARKSGRLRGFGIAMFVESSGVAPSRFAGAMGARVGLFEAAHIRVDPAGGVRAALGTHSHGQGHATTFAQIISDGLGIPLTKIEVVEGDTNLVPFGTGTFGSRSIAVGGSALKMATQKIIHKGRRLAAHLLEASVSDVEYKGGNYRVTGTDRRLSFAEIARAAHTAHDYPPNNWEPGLEEIAVYDPSNFAFSNGAHACEVEVDPDTGEVRLLVYHAVDDIGTVINPVIVEGQIHGGLAQGIGQALLEHCLYEPKTGQILTGSFMDYALPRADIIPPINSELDESQPCTHNPLGAKGCGESGAIGAPASVVSAVLDALAPIGVRKIDMPLTAETIWRAIRGAQP